MLDIKKEVIKLEDEVIKLRRDFHMYPELGYEEYRTSQVIEEYLLKLGLEVKKVSKTGVVGLLRGKGDGKTLLLRADMDAVPQEEKTGLSYQSKNKGVMHACGHDGHMAMLLVAAKILAKHRDKINGNIKFVFQPNEEVAGALDMIKEGVLEDPHVDAAFGVHLWSPIQSGKIGLAAGPVMAALEEFELTIQGKPGHTGAPHTAVDPILASANVIQSIQSIQTREIDPLYPVAIVVGKVHGGSGRNIIADKVELGGTIRFLLPDESNQKKELLCKFERVIKGICEAAHVRYKLQYIPSNPTLYNNMKVIPFLRKAAIETFNTEDNVVEYRCMAGDDFAEFTKRVPSVFYFLGTGNPQKECHYPHHHPLFNIDEDVLINGVEMHVRSALLYLNDLQG
jgi:amidohydrolase